MRRRGDITTHLEGMKSVVAIIAQLLVQRWLAIAVFTLANTC